MSLNIKSNRVGYMLDTNVFNHLIDGEILLSELPKDVSFFICYPQRREIQDWQPSDPIMIARKSKLEAVLKDVPSHQLPTESFILDHAPLNEAKLGNGKYYDKIFEKLQAKAPKKLESNQNDALIGEAALVNGLALITNDQAFRAIFESFGGHAIDLRHPQKKKQAADGINQDK